MIEKHAVNNALSRLRRDLLEIYVAAVGAVDARQAVHRSVQRERRALWIQEKQFLIPDGGLIILGAGKVAVLMAAALLEKTGPFIRGGVVSTIAACRKALPGLEVLGAGHPLPDRTGLEASRKVAQIMARLRGNELVFFLLSGGASALLPFPEKRITLEEKSRLTEILLKSGADINEINSVRKHISRIKGGRLAAMAHPSPLVTLSISDVPDDDPATIGSGPTVPDPTTFSQSLAILKKYDREEEAPASIYTHIRQGIKGVTPESPKPGDPVFSQTHYFIICDRKALINAAEEKCRALGYKPVVCDEAVSGDVRELASFHVKGLREAIVKTEGKVPLCLISGGEGTVRVVGKGKGGRNQEFVLLLVREIASDRNICVLSGATDGIDGPTDAAGAMADSCTLDRA